MRMGSLRQVWSLILSGLLLSCQALGQAQTPASPPAMKAAPQEVHPDLKRARRAADRGEKAEAAGRLDEALTAFEEAAHYAPQDMTYATRAAGLRSKLVGSYADAAERDALASRFEQAAEDLAAALAIDPANAIILERLREIKSMGDEAGPKAAQAIPGLPRLKPQAGTRNLDLRGDTKTVYEQMAGVFGIRVTFDPDLTVRTVHLSIEDVDFQNALKILAAQTGTFWRPVNATLMFVAADTPEKRRQYDLQAEQIFPLSSAISSEDATEVLRILRDITGAPHIDLDTRMHSITMRDTPEHLALTGALIQQLERARGELMLEIELLEVDKNTARKLGVEPPTSQRLIALPPNLLTQLTQANNLTALQTLLAGIFGSAATGSSSVSSLIPPIVAVGGGKSTFLLTLPSAAADFSDALSLVQTGRQVLLRAQDGKPATFFVGERFPITLSLLSGSLGTSTFTPNLGGANNPFPSTSFAAGKGPAALVAADFRNNGSLDLAAVNEIDNSVTVLLNQNSSQGTFAQATGSPIALLGGTHSAAPTTHPGIASATFTNSGCHDLVVSDPLANEVDVLVSNCDGTFQNPVAVRVGSNPTGIATGDFNGDGKQDFAVVNQNDDSVSIFLGDGTGKFTASTASPFVLAHQLVITSTSLSDGALNTAYNNTLQSIGGTGAVTWSLTTGTLPAGLTLTPSTGVIFGTPTSDGTSAITVNAIDSASPPNSATIALSITVNATAPSFAISTASLPNGTIGVPYDQIMTATGGTSPFKWTVSAGSLPAGLTLNPSGEITGTPTSSTTTPPNFTFTVTATDSSSPTPLTAQKQFTLTPIASTDAERGPVAIAQNDFNADGNQDLAIVNQATNNVTILLGKGDGTFTEATGSPISSGIGNGPVAIAAGDLNGDSKPDLAIANQTDNTVSVLLNNGDATFIASASSPLQTGAGTLPNGVAIADFNHDGLADIAVTNGGANSFSVFVGISGGLFTQAFQPPAGPNGSSPTAIVAGALAAGSSLPDVAITNEVSGAAGDVTVVLSPSSLFTNGVAPGVLQQPYPGSEYVDLGVKVKATPTLHSNAEVTLQLEFEIRALAGSAVNGIPILSNRTLSQTVRVKENEPTLITGMTDTEETHSIAGLPGFASVPGLRYAFSSKSHAFQDTELLIVITPRRLRLTDHLTRTIYAGRGDVGRSGAGGGFRGTPAPVQPQPQQPEPPLQQPQPRPEQRPEQPQPQPQPQPQQPQQPQP